ncbi:uncharacterized protein [Onthophagus taurus]|uniref:uncharacterized protein n=1 Tax=Onthophagus taurus TaxID=166361 RepID=UPI000C2092FB|nr:uncharacterized protein LOC111413063 [Onthophagus taurus]
MFLVTTLTLIFAYVIFSVSLTQSDDELDETDEYGDVYYDGFDDMEKVPDENGKTPEQKICNKFEHFRGVEVYYYWEICKTPSDNNGNRNYTLLLYSSDGRILVATEGVSVPSMNGEDIYGEYLAVNETFN